MQPSLCPRTQVADVRHLALSGRGEANFYEKALFVKVDVAAAVW
jgi:hypothetical protein